MYTCVPHPEPPSLLAPPPIPQGHPSAPSLSTLSHALNMDWQSVSHMIIYYVFLIPSSFEQSVTEVVLSLYCVLGA